MEVIALVGFIFMRRTVLDGHTVNAYIDNNNAIASELKGDSSAGIIAAIVAAFWRARADVPQLTCGSVGLVRK